MRSILRKLIHPFRDRRAQASEEKWLAARQQEVISSLTSPISPLTDKPYIEGGTYEWCVEDKVKLDFFFPPEKPGQVPIAVKVTGRHHGPYSLVQQLAPSRAFWAARCQEDFFTVDVCQRAGIPLLLVTPDDPADPFSLSLRIKSLITKK